MATDSKMQIEYIKLEQIKPYERNPRKNDDAVKYVKQSIKEFGFKVPIVLDKDNVIVAGHTRYNASKELGLKEVPCIHADDLSEEQIKAFRLADNKVSEFAEWDFNMLNDELFDISNLEMEDFGFESIHDEFGTDFELPSGERDTLYTMTFTLSQEQKSLIDFAMEKVSDAVVETFGNTNKSGNELYEVVRQWAELRK